MRWWRKLPVIVTKMQVQTKRMYVWEEALALERLCLGRGLARLPLVGAGVDPEDGGGVCVSAMVDGEIFMVEERDADQRRNNNIVMSYDVPYLLWCK
jgi:hypothetical protein